MRSGLVCRRRFASSSSASRVRLEVLRSARARWRARSPASPMRVELQLDAVAGPGRPTAARTSAISSASTSGPGEAQRLDVDLVELAVAALLRPLVAEHRAHGTTAAAGRRRAGCARSPRARCRRWLRAAASARSPFSSSTKVYISFSTMSVTSPMPRTKQRRRLDDRRAHVAVAVAAQPARARVSSSPSHSAASSGRMSFIPRTACIVWLMLRSECVGPRPRP